MRIGIDARFYSSSFTGIGRYVFELIENICALDPINEYVLFFNNPEFGAFAPPRKNVTKILADSPHYSLGEQFHFWRVLERANLDLMHFTHFNAPILYRKPSIVTIHDLTLSFYPGKKMAGPLLRFAYNMVLHSITKRSKSVIAVSENTKRDLIRLTGTPEEKIRVIHLGVNPQFHCIADTRMIGEFRRRMGLAEPYLLYTGVWRNHKNLVNLIRAFGILKNKHNFRGWLVITGKEDPWYPEVKQAVKDLHLEGEVRFTGLVPDEDLVLLYNGALMFVLPSLYEGFGLPALEAFACGLPVAATNTSSIPEVCGDGNAVFFDPKNPQDMAEKIAAVYTDSGRMEELRARGLARAKEFSWQRMASQTLDIYKSYVHADSKTHPRSGRQTWHRTGS